MVPDELVGLPPVLVVGLAEAVDPVDALGADFGEEDSAGADALGRTAVGADALGRTAVGDGAAVGVLVLEGSACTVVGGCVESEENAAGAEVPRMSIAAKDAHVARRQADRGFIRASSRHRGTHGTFGATCSLFRQSTSAAVGNHVYKRTHEFGGSAVAVILWVTIAGRAPGKS